MGRAVHEGPGEQQEEVRGDRGVTVSQELEGSGKEGAVRGGKMQSQGSGSSSEGQGGYLPRLEASGSGDSGKTTAPHMKGLGRLLSGEPSFRHKKAKGMFTEVASVLEILLPTDRTGKGSVGDGSGRGAHRALWSRGCRS